MVGELEVQSDRDGAVVLGFVAEDVLYMQCIELLKGALGSRHAQALERLLLQSPAPRLFLDCSSLESYDLASHAAVTNVVIAHRRRIHSVLVLVRSRLVESTLHPLVAALGNRISFTRARGLFVAALDHLAPSARQYVQNPSAWSPIESAP